MKKYTFTFCAILATSSMVFAQKKAPDNWFNLDMKKDKVPGVSTERAYTELLSNKKSTTIVVAVIDGGTEVDHEDLKAVIWTNPKEIPGNGIDDDNNGYIDDIHGWNFIGGKDGDVDKDNLELARVYKQLTDKYKNTDPKAGPELEYYLKVKNDYEKSKKRATSLSNNYGDIVKAIDGITSAIGTKTPTAAQLKTYKPASKMEERCIDIASKNKLPLNELRNELQKALDHFKTQLDYNLNIDLDTRTIVGDNYNDINERIYGNNSYEGPEGGHGTHVAGIIAAVRDNNLGMKGVANNVQIMVVRVVPNGDERDKDVANGIRYAVDNGAKIINMSFGKSYSPGKSAVDEAIQYAVSKNVLLVHAAGNDSRNTDTTNNFPRDTYNNGNVASSWIEVGASNWEKGKKITANFSNYAAENVDVFAPGVDIYSTVPDSKYDSYDGTSMASPVTAGVAALVWSYYPTLTAEQVKAIILESAVKVKGKVQLPGDAKRKVKMTELCKTGAIVNAYEAIKLAEIRTQQK